MVSKTGKLFLNKEVTIEDLNKGIEFEVDYDEQNTDSEDETYFNDVYFETFKEDISEQYHDRKPVVINCVSFAKLKNLSQPITPDEMIWKQTFRNGSGETVTDKSVVLIHYEAYLENKAEPFDSTRLRKVPYKCLIGDGKLVPGLDLAIKTMKKNEISRFLVSPDYAYGSMGCPPRIPPSAEILYDVELINFYPIKAAIDFEDMTSGDQKMANFETVFSVYQCEHQFANDLFHKKLYRPAIARYRLAKNMLEDVSVNNEEEDEKRKRCLLKVYLNLSQCYINVQSPSKALTFADLALKIDDENPKALYRLGYAYYLMAEYEKAEHYLIKAKSFKLHDKAINAAIAEVERKRKQHLDWEKLFSKNMLGTDHSSLEKEQHLRETPEFISAVEEEIQEFVNSGEKEMTFSSGYTEDQLEVVKEVAKKFNLVFVSKIVNDLKINKVVKKNCQD